MEVKTQKHPAHLELSVVGRLDGYWSDQLTEQLAALIREGHHRILLNASELSFMSSAGLRVMIRTHRQLKGIGGAFAIASPSEFVREVITLSHLHFLLTDIQHFGETPVGAPALQAPAAPAAPVPTPPRIVDLPSAIAKLYTLKPAARAAITSLGSPQPFGAAVSVNTRLEPNQIAWGVGAFGDSFGACRSSFGEFLALGGGVAALPTDRANRPDFLLTTGEFAASVEVLSAICATGDFAFQLGFDRKPDAAPTLAELAQAALDAAGTDLAVVAILGETAGLVGAMLSRSPALARQADRPLEYPAIRQWMRFTTERAHAGESVLIVGIVARNLRPDDAALASLVRPIGNNLHAHLHAAAFGYRPLPRGLIDLAAQTRLLFEEQPLRGVLHLIQDERPIVGAGVSQMIRGAMWIAPASLQENRP